MNPSTANGVEIRAPLIGRATMVFTREALEFLADLHRHFDRTRQDLLRRRAERQARIDQGDTFDFLPETAAVREGSWKIGPLPADLHDRRVEITGPVERKMMINALNSGAKVFMADFEDANSPTWDNVCEGQQNIHDSVRRTIELDTGEKQYRLNDETATLVIRPRGWHMVERHHQVDGAPISASLFDFGLVVFNNAREQLDRGTGPYFYLPKLQSHLEARLWAQAFALAEEAHAIGGMAAFIPSRRDPEVNAVAMAKVKEDKAREAGDGFDGTWVAHPDLVSVAMAEFDAVLGDRPNQVGRKRDDVSTTEEQL